jgi:hypothetical protein
MRRWEADTCHEVGSTADVASATAVMTGKVVRELQRCIKDAGSPFLY